jgi:hypothetical protein
MLAMTPNRQSVGRHRRSEHGDGGPSQRLLVASGNQRTELAFAAILMLALLGICLFGLVALAEKLICPWYDRSYPRVCGTVDSGSSLKRSY